MRHTQTRCARGREFELKRVVQILHLRAMREWAFRVFLGVVCVSGSSRAESRVRPGELVQAATDVSGLRRLLTSPSEWMLGSTSGGTSGARGKGGAPGVSYSQMLGALIVTRDLRFPGTSFLALRLIPTRRALGGEIQVPVVLRPRVIATGWYGVDALVRF